MSSNERVIVGFISDLLFSTRVESIAEKMGYRIIWYEPVNMLQPGDQSVTHNQYAEQTEGPAGVLMDQLTRWHPVMIIMDLGDSAFPWRSWLPLLKSAPATRRIPVVGYASHMDTQTIKYAQSAGADVVLARSALISELPGIIEKYTRMIDKESLEKYCLEPLSAIAVSGLDTFNSGKYFEAHELLEEAWNEDKTSGRELYRALLQLAVAYLQIERRNYRGAVKMFLRLRQWIDPLPDTCRGVDIYQVRADAETVFQCLIDLGPEQIAEFDHSLFKPIHFQI